MSDPTSECNSTSTKPVLAEPIAAHAPAGCLRPHAPPEGLGTASRSGAPAPRAPPTGRVARRLVGLRACVSGRSAPRALAASSRRNGEGTRRGTWTDVFSSIPAHPGEARARSCSRTPRSTRRGVLGARSRRRAQPSGSANSFDAVRLGAAESFRGGRTQVATGGTSESADREADPGRAEPRGEPDATSSVQPRSRTPLPARPPRERRERFVGEERRALPGAQAAALPGLGSTQRSNPPLGQLANWA